MFTDVLFIIFFLLFGVPAYGVLFFLTRLLFTEFSADLLFFYVVYCLILGGLTYTTIENRKETAIPYASKEQCLLFSEQMEKHSSAVAACAMAAHKSGHDARKVCDSVIEELLLRGKNPPKCSLQYSK